MAMPSSVLKAKIRYAEMTDEELSEKLKHKSDEELIAMAWRHGYGKGSREYVKRVRLPNRNC